MTSLNSTADLHAFSKRNYHPKKHKVSSVMSSTKVYPEETQKTEELPLTDDKTLTTLDKFAKSLEAVTSLFFGHQGANIEDNEAFEFDITLKELGKIVNFDQRNDPGQLEILEATYDGVSGVAQKLKTNLKNGLTLNYDTGAQFDVALQQKTGKLVKLRPGVSCVVDGPQRLSAFGTNVIDPPRTPNLLEIIFEKVKTDVILKILLISALLALIVGMIDDPKEGWVDSVAILIAVTLVAVVGSWNDYSKEQKFKKLLLMQSAKKIKVIRNGKNDEISSWDLLVGDVVELNIGDEVPADGIFIDGDNLVIDESPLTGESEPVAKDVTSPLLFSGCQVSEGKGTMLVTTVGRNSTGGQIQSILMERQSKNTPLQEKLEDVANFIGKVALVAAILTVVVLIIRWGVNIAQFQGEKNDAFWKEEVTKIFKIVVLGVTILVVCMPDGLPLAVAMSLGFSMFKMIKEQCFVRTLSSSETMGAATCICTDKTGTLTENRMSVVKLMTASTVMHGAGSGEPDAAEYTPEQMSEAFKDGLPMFIGSSTEGSLLVFAGKLGIDYEKVRKSTRNVKNGQWLFNSTRKKMSTLVYRSAKESAKESAEGSKEESKEGSSEELKRNGVYRLHTKGASEIILKLCTHFLLPDGREKAEMTSADAEKYEEMVRKWASEGLRTFALAYKDCSVNPRDSSDAEEAENPELGLTLLCLCGIKDPVRPDVPAAVLECQNAGLVVRMVTGDNILTACKIAKECNILTATGIALEGPKFRKMAKEDQLQIIPKLQVLARSSPFDKYVLVSLLKELGEVVAVTGDGTNDAPALKEADVGFSMGISGTQIAINASDIVLMQDNFVSIVAAIRYGRNVLNCVRKFLQFQLSINCVATIMTFVSAAITGIPILNSAQLLWINLIMDSFGALSLASDPPDVDILQQKPHRRNSFILTKEMNQHIISVTIFQLVLLLTIYFQMGSIAALLDPSINEGNFVKYEHSMMATTVVVMQLLNQFMSRQLHNELNIFAGAFTNSIFISIIVIIAGIQVLLIHVGYNLFEMVPLNAASWGVCIALGFATVPAVIVTRYILTQNLKLADQRGKNIKGSKMHLSTNKNLYGSQMMSGSQFFKANASKKDLFQ